MTHGNYSSTGAEVQAIQQMLRNSGMSVSRAEGMQAEIQQAIHNVASLGNEERQRLQNLGYTTEGLVDSIRQLTIASDEATAAFRRGSTFPGGDVLADLSSSRGGTAGDVVVGSSGYLPFPVSAGDMLVHRGELARAIAGERGDLVQPPSNQQVSATPNSGGSGGGTTSIQASFEIPVTIDGREVARAVGSRMLEVDQRRGTRIRAGDRRRVAETGVR
jgi:hypothetical protein